MAEKDIKNECLLKWQASEEEIEWFKTHFEDLCEFATEEEREVCFKLLKNFDFYSKRHVNINFSHLQEQLVEDYHIDPEYTIYTVLKDKYGRANSSLEYFLEYIYLNKINDKCKIEDLESVNEEAFKYIQNIVVIDDCIGTGSTLMKYLDKYKEMFQGKKIYVVLIHAIEDFIEKVKEYAKENKLMLEIVCENVKKKAFHEETDEIIEKFKQISRQRGIPSDFTLGKGKVEGLMSFYNNTPNNTLGIFWYTTEQNTPLFHRKDDDKPGWLKMMEQKRERNVQNYENHEGK